MKTLITALLIAVAPVTRAQSSGPHVADSSASLDQLDWLQGYWTGEKNGTRTEELWLPPRGNIMIGVHVDLFPSGRTFFEYLRIEQRGDTLVYAASPRGRPPTYFTATEIGDGHAVFENPSHDFPQVISYRVDSDGRLHSAIRGVEAGAERSAEWVWEGGSLPER